ncbi:NnrS family protein [Suttonella sp. R2A3]|uniref:NnrS family protein n=1 Tax=Suttonella sp. R2A3 TaxID=2908648 RepID=UPI001F1AC966|nr:NnrS family protein [Suttonella sp. R2A3]UJF23955.1 NnrS family protein [Suttonella sp. R2A3]
MLGSFKTRQNLEHPFRLFFLLAITGIIVALMPWFSVSFAPQYAGHFPLHWHAFAFIELVGGAAFAGFLLTALPSWCSYRPPLRYHSILLVLLLGVALICLPWPRLSSILINGFWLYLLGLAARYIVHTRSWHHASFIGVVSAIAALSIAYSLNPQAKWLHASVDVMIIGIALANFRVGRVLGNQALEDSGIDDEQFIPNPFYKNISALLLMLAASLSLLASEAVQGWLYLAVGMSFAARLQDWHDSRLLKRAYIRVYYAVSLSMAFGYMALGLVLLTAPQLFSFVRHFLAIAVYLLMVLTIMSIVGLRHSGLKLRFYFDTQLAMLLVVVAALSRSVLVIYYPSLMTLYTIPSVALSLAFIIYIARYQAIFRHHEPR